MGKRPAQHVVPHDGGWAVRKEGSNRVTSQHATKSEAESSARAIAAHQATELVVHGKDGTIQRRDSHGSDPFPPQG
jgi:uncharacterized protein YdaT